MSINLRLIKVSGITAVLGAVLILNGCATVEGPPDPQDPFESYNRAMYKFNEGFDRHVAKPVAQVYRDVVPVSVNKGISNFFSNLDDVIVLVNDLLQFKFEQSIQDTTRILFNSTFGLFGLIDVSSEWDLPKHNEDFGQTLGYWGVPAGPYFVLPFLGPSTIRDSAGLGTDYVYFDPVFNRVGDPLTSWSLFTLNFVDHRADLLGISGLLDTAALDPYIFTREAYLQRRQRLVYDGNPPMEHFDCDDEPEPAANGRSERSQ